MPSAIPAVFDVIATARGTVMVLMERLIGPTLDGLALDPVRLGELVGAIDVIHSTRPSLPWNAYRDLPDMANHVQHLAVTTPDVDPSVLRRWERFRDRVLYEELSVEPKLVFGRGDPNLQNIIDTSDGLRFVDFEYAGMIDETYALADLAAHIRSAATPISSWRAVFAPMLPDVRSQRRFDRCVTLLAFFWYLRLTSRNAATTDLA